MHPGKRHLRHVLSTGRLSNSWCFKCDDGKCYSSNIWLWLKIVGIVFVYKLGTCSTYHNIIICLLKFFCFPPGIVLVNPPTCEQLSVHLIAFNNEYRKWSPKWTTLWTPIPTATSPSIFCGNLWGRRGMLWMTPFARLTGSEFEFLCIFPQLLFFHSPGKGTLFGIFVEVWRCKFWRHFVKYMISQHLLLLNMSTYPYPCKLSFVRISWWNIENKISHSFSFMYQRKLLFVMMKFSKYRWNKEH